MPVEGAAEVVNGGTPTSDGVVKPEGQKPQEPVAGAQPDKSRDYDKELAGLRNDLIKERKARQQYETDLKTRQSELDTERKRVLALSGVNPKSVEEEEDAAIQAAFAKRFPHLAGLTAEDVEAIKANRESAASLKQTTDHYWGQHAQKMVSKVTDLVAEEIGGKLTDRQKARLQAAYVNEADSNPEFLARHEKGDETLLTEFAKQWVEDWFEPARRKVTQQETQRFRQVPSGKDRGIVTQGEKKIDVNDPKAVEDFLVASYKERGGTFGRR